MPRKVSPTRKVEEGGVREREVTTTDSAVRGVREVREDVG